MTAFNDVVTGIIALVSILSGAGVFAALSRWGSAAKTRAEAKKNSECGHKETQELLGQLIAGQQQRSAGEQALADENAALRKECAVKDKRIEKLERDLTKALTLAEANKKKGTPSSGINRLT